MKKYITMLLAGVMALSLCACGGKLNNTNSKKDYSNPEEVTVTLTLFDTSKTVEEYVEEMNVSNNTENYSVYDEHHYSLKMTEGERQKYLDNFLNSNTAFSQLYSDELFSGAFISDEHDELFQNITFYVDGSKFSVNAEILAPAASLLTYTASDTIQAYSMVDPKDRVYNFQIVSQDSGDVLSTLKQTIFETPSAETESVENTEE